MLFTVTLLGIAHNATVSSGFTVSLGLVPRGLGMGSASVLHEKGIQTQAEGSYSGGNGRRRLGML